MSRSIVKIDQVIAKVTSKLRKSMNKPVMDYKNKGVSVAVWPTKNGGYSYSIQKRYKDKQSGDWKESKYYYKEEVEGLIELLQEAVKYASNRAEHDVDHMASGGYNSEKKAAAKHEEIDMDDLPF